MNNFLIYFSSFNNLLVLTLR